MEQVLISTFGFDASNVFQALRWLPYDRLVLVAGQESLRKPGFRSLQDAERAAGADVETVRVDPFDFISCFEGTCAAIERQLHAGNEVRVNISGGTKVLADAALLASYHEGVPAWHCEAEPLRLPALRGVRFEDSLSACEHAALKAVRGPTRVAEIVEHLRAQGHGTASANRSIISLRERGLLKVVLQRGAAVASLNPESAWFLRLR